MVQALSRARLIGGASALVLAGLLPGLAAAQSTATQPAPAAGQPGAPDASASEQAAPAEAASAGDTQSTPQPGGEQPANDGDTEVDEVVVTGFRGALQSALNQRRTSNDIIDVIRAEDIADFPDLNLAESIQRVPGVSITRDAGEGRQITVRGLGPQFTRVRINGMEGLSTTGGTDSSGGANRARSFDFNVFASELFNSITVRKTQAANVEEGSLGATVDLQTSRPFDYRGFQMAASIQGGYNDLSEEVNPRAAFLISDRWLDGNLGALFSASFSRRNLLEEGFSTVRWDNGPSNGGYAAPTVANGGNAAATTLANAAGTFSPRIPRYGRLTHEQERIGLTGSIQWRAGAGSQINLDYLYSEFSATRQEDFLEAISFSRPASQFGKPQTSVLGAETDGFGTLRYGLFNGVDIRSESRYDELRTIFRQFTLSGSHEFNDRFRVSGLLGRSTSDFNNPIQTTITLDRANSNGYSFDFRNDTRLPILNYGFDVRDPNAFTFTNGTALGAIAQSEIRLRPQFVTNTFETAVFDATWDVTDIFTLRAGYDFKEYGFSSEEYRRASETSVPALPAGTTLASLTTLLTGYGRNLDMPAGNPNSWLIPDINRFAQAFNIYCNCGTFTLGGVNNTSARGNIRGVVERDHAGYLQLDFDIRDALPWRVRGDVGVRYVETNQVSRGYQLVGATPVLVTTERSYTDTLPALNMAVEFTDDFQVRFAAARVVSRPNLNFLTPGGSITTVGNRTITAGNPFLDPIRATNYDLQFEWYFAPQAAISVGFFYKDVETFIQTLQETAPFNTFGFPDSVLAGTGVLPTDSFVFSRPVNTEGGPLRGFEINYQQPFTFLPGFWSRFGALLNYTYVESEIEYLTSATGASTVTNDLTGLSRNAWNATLYYEDDRLSARVSAAYRDRYLTAVPAANAAGGLQDADGTNETLNVDAAASFAVTPNFRITLEALNLTDEYNNQFTDTRADRVVVYHHTGREIYLGARYTW